MRWHSISAALAFALATPVLSAQPGVNAGSAQVKAPHGHKAAARVVELTVTKEGFTPKEVKLKKGAPVKLVVTRTVEKTCATEIVIKDHNIRKDLPLNQAVTIEFTPKQSGTIRYGCAMDMITGVLMVE